MCEDNWKHSTGHILGKQQERKKSFHMNFDHPKEVDHRLHGMVGRRTIAIMGRASR